MEEIKTEIGILISEKKQSLQKLVKDSVHHGQEEEMRYFAFKELE